MRLILLLTTIFFSISFAQAQIQEPVKWTFDSQKIDENTVELTFTASVDAGWYVYAQDIGEDGPVPTEFNFETLKGGKTMGKVEEIGKAIKTYDSMFDMDLKYYKNQVQFKQRIQTEGAAYIEGYLTFMTCNGKQCLPPTDIDFKFEL